MSSVDIYYELRDWAMELCLYGDGTDTDKAKSRAKVNRIEKIADKYYDVNVGLLKV